MRFSTISGIWLLIVAVGCQRPAANKDPSESEGPSMPAGATDWKQLHGTWKIVDSSRTGEARQRDLEMAIRFEGDRMTFVHKDGKSGDPYRYGISASQSPKHLDLVQLDAEGNAKDKKSMPKGPDADAVTPGIYDLNGDALVLVISGSHKEDRPTSLDEVPASPAVRYRLERVK